MQETAEDLELFYEDIDFDLIHSLEKPSPSGTINLKYVFPLSTEVRQKQCGSDEAQILFESASGGQKRIYKSRLLSDGRLLGLAFMKDSQDLNEVEAFLHEATIARSLKHPNIVEVYDCGIDQQYGPYMVMPWIEGGTLQEVLKNLRNHVDDYVSQFPLSRLLKYFKEICSAVDHAHKKDIIHLDLKPENLLINYLTDKALVTDWGLAQFFKPIGNIDPVMQLQDCPGYLRGTPGYMSPEQIMELHCDKRTDIYQLGGILYAIIFHRCPVNGGNVEEVLSNTLAGDIYVDSLSEEIIPYVGICKKAMQIKPGERYSEVREIIDDLETIEQNFKLTRQLRARKTQIAAFSVLAVFMIMLGFALLYHFIFNVDSREFNVEQKEPPLQVDIMQDLKNFDNNSSEIVKSPVPQWYLFLEKQMTRSMCENSGWSQETMERYFEFINSAGREK